MAEYVSEIKHSIYNNDTVYAKLSNLNTFEALRQRMSDPGAVEMMMSQLPEDQRDPEKLQKAVETLQKLQITTDSIGYPGSPVGDLMLGIVDREEPKCIKFALLGAPIQANMWIQLLPATDGGTRMKVTVKVDLNFMMKAMVGSKLEKGVDGFANILEQLPYGMM